MATPSKVLYSGTLPLATAGVAPWTASTIPYANWNAVAYGGGMFVAVNGAGGAVSSPDGITWTARTMPTASNWVAVTYGGGQFVAVSYVSNAAASSPDGITWTARTLPSSNSWRAITYGNGLYVAVAYNTSTAATSPDGITWTARTLSMNTGWYAIGYGRGLFVALAVGVAVPGISPDGINWYNGSALPAASTWRSVAFSAETGFLAVASDTTNTISSPDGYTWTTRGSTSTWSGVVAGEDAFAAVTSSGVQAGYSPDGVTWQQGTNLPSSLTWTGIAYGAGMYVAVASDSFIAASSPNPANILYRAPAKTVLTSITLTTISGTPTCSLRIGKVPLIGGMTGSASLDVRQTISAGTTISGYASAAGAVGAYILGEQ